MQKMLVIVIVLILQLFICQQAYCAVELIKAGMIRDGGSLYVIYKKDNQITKCFIDHREKYGTGEVFIGGKPDLKKHHLATNSEMKSVYKDINAIMESDEYKKYSAMSRNEVRSFMVLKDKKKMDEFFRILHYLSLKDFNKELMSKIK